MSYSAQGWAQRQRFGCPYLKGVMQALCYLMRDDELTVWAAIVETGRKSSLEWYTEFEERAIRRALRQLVDLGYLLDTGERRNNMTVWRMPRYEAWLARADSEGPPVEGRASGNEAGAPTQPTDPSAEKTAENSTGDEPPRQGEGLSEENSSPPVQGSKPSRPGVSSPPVQGRESSLDPPSTKPARAWRLEEWKAQARVRHERAPNAFGKDIPAGTLLKGHWRFWRRMVDWYGRLWLEQWGLAPSVDWIRVLNIWNDSRKWTELEELLDSMLLERPPKPPMVGEIEDLFRKQRSQGTQPYDEAGSRTRWRVQISGQIFSLAHIYGVGSYGATSFADIKAEHRQALELKRDELIERVIAGEKEIPRKSNSVLQTIVNDELVAAMKLMAKPPPSEILAAPEEPVFSE